MSLFSTSIVVEWFFSHSLFACFYSGEKNESKVICSSNHRHSGVRFSCVTHRHHLRSNFVAVYLHCFSLSFCHTLSRRTSEIPSTTSKTTTHRSSISMGTNGYNRKTTNSQTEKCFEIGCNMLYWKMEANETNGYEWHICSHKHNHTISQIYMDMGDTTTTTTTLTTTKKNQTNRKWPQKPILQIDI